MQTFRLIGQLSSGVERRARAVAHVDHAAREGAQEGRRDELHREAVGLTPKLGVGPLADLAVLSQDVFTVEEGRLPETTSLLTVIGGRVVYDAPLTSTERSPR